MTINVSCEECVQKFATLNTATMTQAWKGASLLGSAVKKTCMSEKKEEVLHLPGSMLEQEIFRDSFAFILFLKK